ncbi:MAG: NAD(P)/FAD-dependent oxidoreductase [Chthoniobacteraceae bacterium]|nr:NAD(P)/FAD-dependent oxidoreductase [Chthoniobacteraceae bacterium]
MCAIEAGKRGRRVALLDHQDRVGKKIAISGGGRCNFTNLAAGPANYISRQPDFCKSALARYTPADFIALIEKHGIAYHEKKLGQQFCDESARLIIEMLLEECAENKVQIRLNCRITDVSKTEAYKITTNQGVFTAHSVVVATGGLSFPKLGATDLGYRIAKKFDLRLTETRPGLVPLTFAAADMPLHELSGLSIPVVARNRGREFHENLLFTHRGLSGPAILQISSYWGEGEILEFDLLPGIDAAKWLADARAQKADLPTLLSRHWPRRFAEAWCARHAPSKPISHFKALEAAEVARCLNRWPMNFSGTEGYAKAEVTLGGVDTNGLSSKTMEARKTPGLYFIGEVVDVTGWLGGYNFQWAWASGHAAGQVV